MIRSLWTSAAGMTAQQMNVDVISNNLANVNTPGYKRASLQFEDVMYSTERPPGAKLGDGSSLAAGLQVGHGSKPVATARSFSQGELQNTGGELDVAIQGKGFYRVLQADGTPAYTRDGGFKLNADGEVVTNNGFKLDGASTVDPGATSISVARDGTFSAIVDNQVQQLSPITLTSFANPEGLLSIGQNLYIETEASGTAESGLTPGQNGMGQLSQGYIEVSNVRVVEEMVRLIQAQRAYEINSKAIQTSDEMMAIANALRR